MIKRKVLETLPLSTIRVGEQAHFNHDECPAGEDTRGRLYVKRKYANLYVAYCHNCGEAGVLKSGVYTPSMWDISDQLKDVLTIKEDEPATSTFEQAGEIVMPPDFTTDASEFDPWSTRRLWNHHTTHTVATEHGWGFSPSLNQLITPIYHRTGKVVGYQGRNAPGIVPKCITTYANGRKGSPLFYVRFTSNTLVIVEDPLSAMRLHQECNVTSVALLGTHLNVHALHQIIKWVNDNEVTQLVIWMDDDAAGRIAGLSAFKQLSSLFASHVNITVSTKTEPKLIELLKETMTWT